MQFIPPVAEQAREAHTRLLVCKTPATRPPQRYRRTWHLANRAGPSGGAAGDVSLCLPPTWSVLLLLRLLSTEEGSGS